jgi:hypothetical protein
VEAKELMLEEGDAVDLVVDEEAGYLLPHVARGVTITDNGVKYVGGDGLEEPADDGGIDGALVKVMRHGEEVDGAIDVVEKIVLTKEEAEVHLPREVVGRSVGELDRHALEDRDVADDGDGGADAAQGCGGTAPCCCYNVDNTNVEGTTSTCCSRYRSRGIVLDIALGAGAVKSLVQSSLNTRSNPRS